MGKEQLYFQLDQLHGVVEAMDIVHDAQKGTVGEVQLAVDRTIDHEDIRIMVNGQAAVEASNRLLQGEVFIRPNIRAKERNGESLPKEPGMIPVRVNGEIIIVPEVTLDDVYVGKSGYTERQREQIEDHTQKRREDAATVLAVDRFLYMERYNKDGEDLVADHKKLIEEESR